MWPFQRKKKKRSVVRYNVNAMMDWEYYDHLLIDVITHFDDSTTQQVRLRLSQVAAANLAHEIVRTMSEHYYGVKESE